MKIAFCTYPLVSAHKDRGIGVYTKNLLNLLSKQKIDLITFDNPKKEPKADLTHYPYFDIFFHTMPIRCKNKRVVTVHDVIPLVFPDKFPTGVKGRINLNLQKLALKRSQSIISDSDTSKADASKLLGIPNKKITTVYLAPSSVFKKIIDIKKLNNIKTKYKLHQNFVLFVGNVNWNKNLENLLEAINISKTPLVLIGNSHLNRKLPEVQKLEGLIKKLEIEKLITKTGNVPDDDLACIYNLAATTAVPSYYEGFGFPVLESMACGTPVVCSNNSSLVEIADSGAFYCNPNSPSDISKKIKEAQESKTDANSQKLIKHASKFTWDKVVTETIEVYQKTAK